MTDPSGQTVSGARAAEVAEYVEAVREALRDLPPARLDDLLEDLPAHLAEVAAEDPTPLWQRLGDPADYAAELRAAVEPSAEQERISVPDWAVAQWERLLGRLRRVDVRVGPLIGYERLSEFGRLLLPAWWVLRGYLAAMLMVVLLDRGGPPGLLPRLGGSTLVGLVLLAAFVAGSVWLAHREAALPMWRRRAVLAGSALLVLVGAVGFLHVDERARGHGYLGTAAPYSLGTAPGSPYDHLQDIYVFDADGRPLTGAFLLDQNGDPVEFGRRWCDGYPAGHPPEITYPRCPSKAPIWWWHARGTPEPSPATAPTGEPVPSVAPTASAEPAPAVSPTPSGEPAPSVTPAPSGPLGAG